MYYPIFKSRAGELNALMQVSDEAKQNIIPIIELLPEDGESLYNTLSEFWQDDTILIDCSYIKDLEEVIELFENLTGADIEFIPVVEFNSQESYIELLRGYIETYGIEVCIRIRNEFSRPRLFNPLVSDLLNQLNTVTNSVSILFDLGYVTQDNHLQLANSVIANIKGLTDMQEWEDIIIAAGSFPTDLGFIAANSRKLLKRYEWLIWKEVQKEKQLIEYVEYSDYGIKHPIYDPALRGFEGTASIKYTTENDFLIFRGILPSLHPLGGGQYHEKCRLLIKDPLYDGRGFSWGDNEIYECAHRNKKPGNSTSWVTIGQNRHVSKISALI